jgi:hypothetical protein
LINEGVFYTINNNDEYEYHKINDFTGENVENNTSDFPGGPYINGGLFNEGIAIVVESNEYPKAIDENGEIVFEINRDDGVSALYPICTDGRIMFRSSENGLIGFLNKKGEVAISPQFSVSIPFSTPGINSLGIAPPLIDYKVTILDGLHHDVDSSVLAFELAARAGMREGLRKAGAKMLEPIMKVEVVTPEEYTGGIIGDLTSRRGQVQGQEPRGNAIAINSNVPLANMFGYINTLRSMSSGRANFTMQFSHYDSVPQTISDEIQAKYA